MPATSSRETRRDRDGAVGLRYVGGGASLPDIPARDLTPDELDELATSAGPSLMGHGGTVSLVKLLLESGLYVERAAPAAPTALAESEG